MVSRLVIADRFIIQAIILSNCLFISVITCRDKPSEWWKSTKQNICNNPCCPNVNLKSITAKDKILSHKMHNFGTTIILKTIIWKVTLSVKRIRHFTVKLGKPGTLEIFMASLLCSKRKVTRHKMAITQTVMLTTFSVCGFIKLEEQVIILSVLGFVSCQINGFISYAVTAWQLTEIVKVKIHTLIHPESPVQHMLVFHTQGTLDFWLL